MQRCTTLETTPVVLRPSEATKASGKFLQALPLEIMQLQELLNLSLGFHKPIHIVRDVYASATSIAKNY